MALSELLSSGKRVHFRAVRRRGQEPPDFWANRYQIRGFVGTEHEFRLWAGDRPVEVIAQAVGRRAPRYAQLDGLQAGVRVIVNPEARGKKKKGESVQPRYESRWESRVVFVDPREVVRGTTQAVAEHLPRRLRERVVDEGWTGAVRGRQSNEWIQLTGRDKIVFTSP